MEKRIFSNEELSELEALQIKGGSTLPVLGLNDTDSSKLQIICPTHYDNCPIQTQCNVGCTG